jgi:hypothetical protein
MRKDRCSFCLTEDEGIQYLANDDNTACICENCAHLFVNHLSALTSIKSYKNEGEYMNTQSGYGDLFSPIEESWLEKNVINTFVIDDGGSINNLTFSIQPTDDGADFDIVLNLYVSGISELSEDSEEKILNEIEWAIDEIREDRFPEFGLSPENIADYKINLINED